MAEYIVNPEDPFRVGVGGYIRGYTGKVEGYQYNSAVKSEPYVKFIWDVSSDWELSGKLSYRFVRVDRFPSYKRSRIYDAYGSLSSSQYGKVDVGQLRNVAYLMHAGPKDVGSLGIDDSDISYFFSAPKGFYAPYLTYIDADSRDPKISYTTPNLNGFQAGVSFVQSEDEEASTVAPLGIKNDHGKGGIFALRYETQKNDWKVVASGGYALYDQDRYFINDTYFDGVHREYSAGMYIEKNDFSFGASYKYIDYPHKTNIERTFAYATGIAYDNGLWGVSLAGLHSQSERGVKNEYTHIMLSGKYMLLKNLKSFVSLGKLEFLSDKEPDDRGYFGLLGLELKI